MPKKATVEFSGTGGPVSTWLPSTATSCLDAEAKKRGIDRSNLVRKLILNFLKAQKSKPPVA